MLTGKTNGTGFTKPQEILINPLTRRIFLKKNLYRKKTGGPCAEDTKPAVRLQRKSVGLGLMSHLQQSLNHLSASVAVCVADVTEQQVTGSSSEAHVFLLCVIIVQQMQSVAW